MVAKIKPSIETFRLAMEEYSKTGSVKTVKCERCNTVIEIEPKGESALALRCRCGLYNDNLRGI